MGSCANSRPVEPFRARESRSLPINPKSRQTAAIDVAVQVNYTRQQRAAKTEGSVDSHRVVTASRSKNSQTEKVSKPLPAEKKRDNSLVLTLNQVKPEDPAQCILMRSRGDPSSPGSSIRSPLSRQHRPQVQAPLDTCSKHSPRETGTTGRREQHATGASTLQKGIISGDSRPVEFSSGVRQELGKFFPKKTPVTSGQRSGSSPEMGPIEGSSNPSPVSQNTSSLTGVAKFTKQKLRRIEDEDKLNLWPVPSFEPIRIPQNISLLWVSPPRCYSPPNPGEKTNTKKIHNTSNTHGLYITPGSPGPSKLSQSKMILFLFVVRKKIRRKEESDLVKFKNLMTSLNPKTPKPKAVLLLNGQLLSMKY